MPKDVNQEELNLKYSKELKSLNNKIIAICSYLIAIRSETIRECRKTENILEKLIKQTYDIRGGLWGCLATIWFVAILIIHKDF